MQFIVSGQRIAVENFVTGKLYSILWKNDTQVTLTCISIGADCVVFQGEAPLNLFTLTMQNADTIDTIEPTQLGTTNYNNLINKPQINGVDLIGNKTSSALGIRDVPSISEADDGKILTASSDGTYTWQPAPSSGTMDYTELNNKPQIAGVTLSGNKSLADLGAAAASDIPTTPADIGAEPAITSENKLDPALIDYDSTHAAITAAQVEQIGTNENNISSFHKASGTDIYFQEDEPTGNIVQGSYWISRSGNKKYETSPNLSNGNFSQGGIYDNGGLNVLTNFVRISVPVTAGQTYSFSSNKLIRTVYGYQGRWDLPTSKTLILSDDTPSETSYTFTVPDNIDNVGISLCNADSSAIVPADVQNFMFNAGETPLPYEPYGVIWH